jgi:hypothetical protein
MWSSEAGRRTQLFAQDEQFAGVTYTYTILQKTKTEQKNFLTWLKRYLASDKNNTLLS